MSANTKSIPCTAGLLLAGLALSLASLAGAQPARRPALTYAKGAESFRLPRTSLQVFTAVRAPEMTTAEAARLAEKLADYTKASLRAAEGAGAKAGYVLKFQSPSDPSAVLRIDRRRGDFLFNGGLAAYREERDTPGLPSREEAVRHAKRHLRSLGLSLPGAEAVLAHVGGLNMAVRREDGTTGDYRKLVTVRFDRKLAGLPVEGDSRLVMQLGESGALAGLVWDWLPAKGRRLAAGEILADGQIRAGIERRVLAESGKAERIVIERLDPVLYDDGSGVIEPAVRVVATRTYRTTMLNGEDEGKVQEYTAPYDTIQPVLVKPKAVYPFMRDPEATRRVKGDEPGRDSGQDTGDDEGRPK